MSVEKGAKRLNRRERYIDDDLRSFTTESELERSSSDSLDILDELRDLRESDISIRDDNTEDAAFNDAKALTVKNAAKEGGSRMQTLIPKLSKEPEGSQSNSEHEEERKNNEHRHLKDQKKREKKDSKAKEKDRKLPRPKKNLSSPKRSGGTRKSSECSESSESHSKKRKAGSAPVRKEKANNQDRTRLGTLFALNKDRKNKNEEKKKPATSPATHK